MVNFINMNQRDYQEIEKSLALFDIFWDTLLLVAKQSSTRLEKTSWGTAVS